MLEKDNNKLSGTNFWKLGCNWGSRNPSFYNVIKSKEIVISHKRRGEYGFGDIVLIAEGHSIKAITQVKSKPLAINSKVSLVNELKKYNVDGFDKISYYEVEYFELPKAEIFKYKLQQGIVRIHQKTIIATAIKLWEERNQQPFIDKRIMRITWNSNNWETPNGHQWSTKNQGNPSIAHEHQYGYGYEEWLFNERFRIKGYQYGFIRGVNNLSEDIEVVGQITLYTIRDDKQRCLVGNLKNVEIIEGYYAEKPIITDLAATYKDSMIEELKEINADFEHLKTDPFLPNVKFKWDEADLFQQPMPVDFLDGPEFNRFQAYHLKDDLTLPIQEEFDKKVKFIFQPGKASNTSDYVKSSSEKKTKVRRRHGEITDDLYAYLLSSGNIEESISVEKTYVGGAIVDVALKVDDGFELFEIKTSGTALKNIRLALGQIFEYALLDEEINCKRLVIIGPAEFKTHERDYFTRLKNLINIKLEYWGYKPHEEVLENKFVKK